MPRQKFERGYHPHHPWWDEGVEHLNSPVTDGGIARYDDVSEGLPDTVTSVYPPKDPMNFTRGIAKEK